MTCNRGTVRSDMNHNSVVKDKTYFDDYGIGLVSMISNDGMSTSIALKQS